MAGTQPGNIILYILSCLDSIGHSERTCSVQDWRFDDLTRTLGKATSRRGVLKGLLGGLVAAVVGNSLPGSATAVDAATTCNDKRACRERAFKQFEQCLAAAQLVNGFRSGNLRRGGSGGRISAIVCEAQMRLDMLYCSRTGCRSEETCCASGCSSLLFDAQNCGACGHACPDGATCEDKQCQCPDDQTICDNQCVDTQTDKNNCGSCGHQCGTCETCSGGQCVPRTCPEGYTCCQDNCIPPCPSGDPPDPNTCQCDYCKDQVNGAACDANNSNMACCDQQCVNTQCASGKQFSYDTCGCQCTSTCPPDQLQDPDTCQCQDLCQGVTCGECQTCDPTSGDCVQVDDQTACGNNQVCCSGTCQDTCTCTGLSCSNGDCCPNSTDWACCENGCCPQVQINGQTGAWCVAAGPDTDPLGAPAGNCCQPSDLVKGSYLDNSGNCQCSNGGPYEVWCANNLVTDNLGTRCSCGPWVG